MKLSLFFFFIPLVIVVLAIFYSAASFSPVFNRGDFRAQYAGAYLIHTGKIRSLYDMDTQLSAHRTFMPTISKTQVLPYYSPPLVAYFLSPLGSLSYSNAYIVFGFSQLIFFFIALAVLVISLHDVAHNKNVQKRNLIRWHVLMIATGLFPAWMSVLHGQLAAVWMLVVAGAWLLYSKSRYVLSGLVLSLLFLKLHLVLTPLLFFIFIKKWRVVLSILIGIFGIGTVSLLMIGFNGAIHYLQFLISLSGMERSLGVSASHQTSLFGLISYLSVGGAAVQRPTLPSFTIPIWIIITSIFMTFTIHRWIQIPNTKPHIVKLKYAHMLTVMLFTSIHTHNYDLSILFVGFVLYIDYILSIQKAQKKKIDKITERYYVLLVVSIIAILMALVSVFTQLSIITYGLFFYLIEKEYRKIQKSK